MIKVYLCLGCNQWQDDCLTKCPRCWEKRSSRSTVTTKEELIKRAEKLRSTGMPFARIGKKLHISTNTARAYSAMENNL